jgi:PAS domain S-box-containing protein
MLIGWNAIARYLQCSLSSARRREGEGLPVFRVGGSVRAYGDEIDAWIRGGRPHPTPETAAEDESNGPVAERPPGQTEGAGVDAAGVLPLSSRVAELERLVALLRSSEAKYRELLENAPVWIWEMDGQGRFRYSNAAGSALLDYLPDEIVGRKAIDLGILSENGCFFEHLLETLRRRGTAVKYLACRFVRRDGTVVHLETTAAPALDASGNVAGVRGVSLEVSARGRAAPPPAPASGKPK